MWRPDGPSDGLPLVVPCPRWWSMFMAYSKHLYAALAILDAILDGRGQRSDRRARRVARGKRRYSRPRVARGRPQPKPRRSCSMLRRCGATPPPPPLETHYGSWFNDPAVAGNLAPGACRTSRERGSFSRDGSNIEPE